MIEEGVLDERTHRARDLFGGIASAYERPAELLSLGQYGRWRRALVRSVRIQPGARVLDVAAGTGLVTLDLERAGARVVAVDLTEAMLRHGTGLRAAADANALPFPDEFFDAVTFSYLLRYVADPPATLRNLVRVLRRGGTLASVEFGIPRARLARAGWHAYARGVFPIAARAFGAGWQRVGTFLPRSILEWDQTWPLERQLAAWRDACVEPDQVEQHMFGTGVVIVGTKR